MNHPDAWFESAFQALTGHRSLRWQGRLFRLLNSGRVPTSCDLPTGIGKTAVMPIWLVALAARAVERPVGLPRRLAYVVDRRTVVDQATDVVELMRERLRTPTGPQWARYAATLQELADRLRSLAAFSGEALAVSTLRGELADNEEWKADPARAAIIVGTIDMIGSKLLFSGYGDGRYHRAHHAGLLGQDVLIIHDEAHLTPAFDDLLKQVAETQRRDGEPRPVQVMALSATLRDADSAAIQLEPEDERDEVVATRLDAEKRLRLHRSGGGGNGLAATLVDLAFEHEQSRARVLIYVRSPEDAQRVQTQLTKRLGPQATGTRIALLTGTVRGHERDELVHSNLVYRALLDPSNTVERTVYLVSTSAGEVGVDLDGDHMVCDLTTLDAMIQRLGRLNRRGGSGRIARVDVVVPDGPGSGHGPRDWEAVEATREILVRWGAESNPGVNVSPRELRHRLGRLEPAERQRAFSPKPEVPPLTDILLDAWSLTSIAAAMPGRPGVEDYLHGLTADPPETYVVWRKEVMELSRVDEDSVRAWFRVCRIEARERLRDLTDRVERALAALLNTHRKGDETKDFPVILIDERGNAEREELSDIVRGENRLAYRTIVLPVEVGGLNDHGMLDGTWIECALDVADRDVTSTSAGGQRRERWLYVAGPQRERYVRFLTGQPGDPQTDGLGEVAQVALQAPREGIEEEAEARRLLLMVSPNLAAETDPESTPITQTLHDHTRAVTECANRIADALGLDGSLKNTLVHAAERHDTGKGRALWQWYACNPSPAVPLAKSAKYRYWRALGGYRHEFGSLLDLLTDGAPAEQDETDLALHLIAAHHGWARPHFEPQAFAPPPASTAQNRAAAAEVQRRFGRLQRRFGRWGLAWLESLLRCADIVASKHSGETAAGSRPGTTPEAPA